MGELLFMLAVDVKMQEAFAHLGTGPRGEKDCLAKLRVLYAQLTCSCGREGCIVPPTKAKVLEIMQQLEEHILSHAQNA